MRDAESCLAVSARRPDNALQQTGCYSVQAGGIPLTAVRPRVGFLRPVFSQLNI